MSDAAIASARKRRAPWRGRMRVKDARKHIVPIRCNDKERAAIKTAAERAGLAVGPFLRKLALGDAGPRAVRRPPVEKAELARLLGALGKIGSNVNQLAHAYNGPGLKPGFAEMVAIRREVGEMRAALLKALGRDH